MRPSRALVPALCVVVLTCAMLRTPATAAPDGQMVWGVHISLAPTWFDPAETPGMITPFMIMYALHDAVVKPMPGQPKAPSLSESWTVSRDGLVYEFVLRKGARVHNGEPVTAEDVKFSFDRYRGTSARALKDQVAAVEVVDPQRVRFHLKRPWPDIAGIEFPPLASATRGTRSFRSAPVRTASCHSRPAWSWSSRPSNRTGARRRV